MKVAITLATLTLGLASAGLAYAEEPYYPIGNATSTSSTVTRAQVLSELRVADAAGELQAGQQPYYPMEAARSTKSRAQVLSELRVAQAAGELQTGELPYYPGFPA